MIKIGILGDIGSGKSYVARNFGYPVFDADYEVSIIYKENRTVFKKLRKIFPKHINSFPIKKAELTKLILVDRNSLKKIIKIVHPEVRKRMKIFEKKNKNQRIIVMDIPLLLENKINKKKDILVFVQSRKSEVSKRLKKRSNYSKKLLNKFKLLQLPLDYKKKKSHFVIKNDFSKKTVQKRIKSILNKLN